MEVMIRFRHTRKGIKVIVSGRDKSCYLIEELGGRYKIANGRWKLWTEGKDRAEKVLRVITTKSITSIQRQKIKEALEILRLWKTQDFLTLGRRFNNENCVR